MYGTKEPHKTNSTTKHFSNFSIVKSPPNNKTMTNLNSTYRGLSVQNPIKQETFTNTGMQSPKISSGKTRSFSLIPQPRMISLVDVNFQKSVTTSTNLPIQFERLPDAEVKKRFDKPTSKWRHKFLKFPIAPPFQDKNKRRCQTDFNQTSKENYSIENNETIKTNKKEETIINKEESKNNSETKFEHNSLTDRKIKRSPFTEIEKQSMTIDPMMLSRNDKWKPNGYDHYELLVKNRKLLEKELLSNPNANRLPHFNLKEIRDKSKNSDIFFTKKGKIDNFEQLAANYKDHQNSDVFMIKNDLTSFEKTGEPYLYNQNINEIYNVSRPSGSEWSSENSMPTLLNHTSKGWNPLNPGMKNTGRTKLEIQNECNQNGFNPILRQKSLCEFIDLCRVGAPNPNRTYLASWKKAPDCFMRRTDLCGGFQDMHHNYKDLVDRPFIEKKLI